MIAQAAGARAYHVVSVQNRALVADGEGGFSETWIDAPPAWSVDISEPGGAQERQSTEGAILAPRVYGVAGAWRPDVSTTSRILWRGRALNVVSMSSPGGRGIDLVLKCAELTGGRA